jgi:LysR family hydrogen peroxide-inducible transcriptional activator
MSMAHLPSLQQLRFLSALAEEGHFGRAAAASAVTQSTLSAGIRELEERLGSPLVERGRRGILLTPLGAEVLARGRRILREAEDIAEIARASQEPLAGSLRLGVIPTIGPYLVPRIMRRAGKAFPRLKLYLREEQTAPLLEKLGDGRLDLALIALPYDTGELETMPLGEDGIRVALATDHRLAGQERIAREDLAGEPLLLMEDGHCLRSHSLQACPLAGPQRNEVFQGTSLRTLVQMVASGLGVTLIPEMAVAAELASDDRLVARRLAGDEPVRVIALAWRPSSPRKAAFRRFGECVAAALRDTAPGAIRRRAE